MSFFRKLFQKTDFLDRTDTNHPTQKEIADAGDFFPPLKGRIVPLSDVPDPVFAEKMMGDGFAIVPESNLVRSPVDGVVTYVFPTHHAISLRADDGHDLLIHVGLETVSLKGFGFTKLVKDGDRVKRGDRLLHVDFDKISGHIPSTITSVIFTNLKDNEVVVIDRGRVTLQQISADEK
jgi:PTS system, glucose subfamily, IIA component